MVIRKELTENEEREIDEAKHTSCDYRSTS